MTRGLILALTLKYWSMKMFANLREIWWKMKSLLLSKHTLIVVSKRREALQIAVSFKHSFTIPLGELTIIQDNEPDLSDMKAEIFCWRIWQETNSLVHVSILVC
jgi:hypothetical protein